MPYPCTNLRSRKLSYLLLFDTIFIFFIFFLNSTALTLLVICEDSGTEQIKCDDGGTIAILSANFGRLDWTTCPHRKIKTNDCRANSSLDKVKEICQHKESCELQATRSFFGGDPCPETYKYLLVEYKCDS